MRFLRGPYDSGGLTVSLAGSTPSGLGGGVIDGYCLMLPQFLFGGAVRMCRELFR